MRTTFCWSTRAAAPACSPAIPSPEGLQMKFTHVLFASMLAATLGAQAQTAPAPATSAGAGAPQNDGEVRKVDKQQGKLTLRHGPLSNLDMPAMTMVFR